MRLELRPELRPLLALLAGVAVIFLFSMGNHPFIPSMEPRFGEVIREMARAHEYLIPIKNGVAYIEYPPLYYWLALAGRLVGLPETYAIRLPTFLSYFFWIVWLWRLQQLVRPGWPRMLLPLTGAALPGVLYMFYIAQTDGMLVLGTLIAFTGFIRFRRREGTFGFPWELWLGVLLATAAKGPVGMAVTLPAMGLEMAAAAWVARGIEPRWIRATFREAWAMGWFRGLALVVGANAPWYIAAGMREGWEFCRAILVYQNFTRFLVGFDHGQPWWYYLKTIWYDMLPLAFLLPFGFWYAWRKRDELMPRTAAVWVIYTVFFFSLSASKQGKYIFTAAPAVAFLALFAVAHLFSERGRNRTWRYLQRWAAGFLTLFGLIVILVPIFRPGLVKEIGGVRGFDRIRAEVAAHPGKIFTYRWPRAMMLYELGSPLPFTRSARSLYAMVHSGQMRPGDYLLVARHLLASKNDPRGGAVLAPRPAPPYFEKVMSVKSDGGLNLYRVLPGADKLPVPPTAPPPPHHWWQAFDTD